MIRDGNGRLFQSVFNLIIQLKKENREIFPVFVDHFVIEITLPEQVKKFTGSECLFMKDIF